MGRLAGKVAVVTGGGTGIGAATARLFLEEGARVLVVGRTEGKLVEIVEAAGTDAISYAVADVAQVEDTRRYVAEALGRYGGIDVLVGNAGIEGPITMVSDCTIEDFDAVIATNLRGVWLSVTEVLPELRRRGGGSIVLTSSIGGLFGFPALAPYIASKHAVVGLARAIAQEVAAEGIRINAVCPGFVDNRMANSLTQRFGPLVGLTQAEVHSMLAARIPMKRWGSDDEIAKLNLFLASDDASYVTGAAYVADGGVTAGLV